MNKTRGSAPRLDRILEMMAALVWGLAANDPPSGRRGGVVNPAASVLLAQQRRRRRLRRARRAAAKKAPEKTGTWSRKSREGYRNSTWTILMWLKITSDRGVYPQIRAAGLQLTPDETGRLSHSWVTARFHHRAETDRFAKPGGKDLVALNPRAEPADSPDQALDTPTFGQQYRRN